MANLNSNISPSPIVAVRSKAGQTQASATNSVTVSLSVNPTGATLSGTLTKSAVAGLATFNDLQLNRSGAGFKLLMTASNLRQTISAAFNIPTKCVFTTQPVSTTLGATLDPIVVTVRDNAGATDTNYNGDVTLSLFAGAATGVLDGITTRTASSGVATFSGLSIDESGQYSLLAAAAEVETAYKPASVVSNYFTVGRTIVAVADTGVVGYISSPALGSLTPSVLGAATIITIVTFDDHSSTVAVSSLVAQNFFTSITIGAVTLLTASATYSQSMGNTIWSWASSDLVSAGTFPGYD